MFNVYKNFQPQRCEEGMLKCPSSIGAVQLLGMIRARGEQQSIAQRSNILSYMCPDIPVESAFSRFHDFFRLKISEVTARKARRHIDVPDWEEPLGSRIVMNFDPLKRAWQAGLVTKQRDLFPRHKPRGVDHEALTPHLSCCFRPPWPRACLSVSHPLPAFPCAFVRVL